MQRAWWPLVAPGLGVPPWRTAATSGAPEGGVGCRQDRTGAALQSEVCPRITVTVTHPDGQHPAGDGGRLARAMGESAGIRWGHLVQLQLWRCPSGLACSDSVQFSWHRALRSPGTSKGHFLVPTLTR